MMRQIIVILIAMEIVGIGAANAALIQEDFESYIPGPGVPAGWFEGYHGPGATWEIVNLGGNQVAKAISGPRVGGGDASAGPDNGTGWYVENIDMQVSLNVLSGEGGGLGLGQFDGASYTGHSYYIEVSIPHSRILLYEAGTSLNGTLGLVFLSPGSLNYGDWYDLRMKSTGTNFEIWFRPSSTAPWNSSEKIIDVPQDLLHPGHKTYVEALAGCWAQNNGAGPSSVLFDDLIVDAVPFPAATTFSDDFESALATGSNWAQIFSSVAFPLDGANQVVSITGTTGPGGLVADQGSAYYTHNFVLRTDVLLAAESGAGGIFWGLEVGSGTSTDYHIAVSRDEANIYLDFDEEQNSGGADSETQIFLYSEAAAAGINWYTLEVVSDYETYSVWFWPHGATKPITPAFTVAQDLAHPGYRLINSGGVGLWSNPGVTSLFDNFYFEGTERPSENTSAGAQVTTTPEAGLELTFDTVTEGGTTTVETSSTAPGGGPGGLQFEGLFYDINTTSVFEGPVTICLTYDDTGMTVAKEVRLRLMHWETANQVWVDITKLPVDTDSNIVCGVTNSFSVFALATVPVLEGFSSPINMPPNEMSVFKKGSTVPVKFRLLDPVTGGAVPDALATIWAQQVSMGVPADVNEELVSTQPDGGNLFRYDPQEEQYIFNLSTKYLRTGFYRVHASAVGGLVEQWVVMAIR